MVAGLVRPSVLLAEEGSDRACGNWQREGLTGFARCDAARGKFNLRSTPTRRRFFSQHFRVGSFDLERDLNKFLLNTLRFDAHRRAERAQKVTHH